MEVEVEVVGDVQVSSAPVEVAEPDVLYGAIVTFLSDKIGSGRINAIRQKTYDRKKEPEEKPEEKPKEKPEEKPEEAETRRGRYTPRDTPSHHTRQPDQEVKPEPPSRTVRPSRRRKRAPDELDGGVPTVEVGSGPTVHAAAPEPPPSDPLLPTRGRTPSGHSDHEGHGHLFRIRKQSEGSVEIFPDFIEEHKITQEYRDPSLAGSHDDIGATRPGVSPGLSLPRSVTSRWFSKASMSPTCHDVTARANSSYSRDNSMKRRIVLERCPHCQDGDSPPEIEIRICKRSGKCGDIVPQESLNLQSQPAPLARASSLNRVPPQQQSNNYESPLSPSYRAKSPSEREMERLAARLEALKKEVNSVIRDCEDDVPISLREAEDRPKSPYYPDKSPYYRARYHSSPQSPTGQNDKTTSTTELPQVYHPAKEEHFYHAERDLSPLLSQRDSCPESSQIDSSPESSERDSSPEPSERDLSPPPAVLHLSTHSLELPGDDEVPITDQLELEVLSLNEVPELQSHFVPVQNQAPSSYEEVYEPECDPNLTTNHLITDTHNRPKREEQLLTPPPLPDRDPQPDITLRGDNLYDPYHIGTTFVVLSRQNHGRFKFSSPLDPNISAPGSPRPATPLRGSPLPGSTSGSSPRSVPRNEAPEVPVITPAVATPVAASPAARSNRPLYQPKSLNSSLMSLTSPSKHDLDMIPSKLVEPSKPVPSETGSPPALPARNPGMSPEKRRGFLRPSKEPAYRELAVDAPDRPILPDRKHSLLEQQRNSASREFHLQTIMDVERPGRLDTWSGAMPPVEGVAPRPLSPYSENSLRRTMPHVKLLGDEWKELAQRLGYENSQIASFSQDYPDPGQALLDHWSRLPESQLGDLLQHLKVMDLWKTADTLDKTFDNTNV